MPVSVLAAFSVARNSVPEKPVPVLATWETISHFWANSAAWVGVNLLVRLLPSFRNSELIRFSLNKFVFFSQFGITSCLPYSASAATCKLANSKRVAALGMLVFWVLVFDIFCLQFRG